MILTKQIERQLTWPEIWRLSSHFRIEWWFVCTCQNLDDHGEDVGWSNKFCKAVLPNLSSTASTLVSCWKHFASSSFVAFLYWTITKSVKCHYILFSNLAGQAICWRSVVHSHSKTFLSIHGMIRCMICKIQHCRLACEVLNSKWNSADTHSSKSSLISLCKVGDRLPLI